MNPRSAILLALAVLLPAAALAILGFVLLGQQQEVMTLRQQDRDLLTARFTADSLSRHLTRIANGTVEALTRSPNRVYPSADSMLYLGRVDGSGWSPPFSEAGSFSLGSRAFRDWEIRHRQLERRGATAAQMLRSIERAPADTARAHYLEFIKGRTLMASGNVVQARQTLEPIAAGGAAPADENGVPLAFYASTLLGPGSLLQPRDWLNPIAQSWLHNLDPLAYREEYRVLASVAPIALGIDNWRLVGDSWLVGIHNGHVLGISAERLNRWAANRPGVAAVETVRSESGMTLAPVFPDLTVRLRPNPGQSGTTGLWLAALFLTVFLSGMAGILLFRDQRREKRLAGLRSKFVSSVSHEVRTPLSAIRLYTEALLDYGDDAAPEERRADLNTIARETGRLTRMLDNVLSFSRVERGLVQYALKEGNLERVLEATARMMRPAMDEAGCDFSTDCRVVHAFFDADAIQQAVVNLLANAARYAPGAGVQLACREVAGEARIVVEDRGPGIDRTVAAHIFEPFYRAHNESDTGTGLGLSIVEHIAHGHGGRAQVEPRVGGGSRFIIAFTKEP